MTVKAMAPFLITKKEELILINYQSGYRTALLDAREAVAKIPKEDGGYCHVLHACDVEDAIDDLRATDAPPTAPAKAKSADLHDPQWGEMIH